MKVLIIVDVQRDFCRGGALAVPQGDEVVGPINQRIHSGDYDFIAATRDWHPRNHRSFFTAYEGSAPFETVMTDDGPRLVFPVHCVADTPGAMFHPKLDISRVNLVVDKGQRPEVDSLSGFFDESGEHETNLRSVIEEELAKRGESREELTVEICGLALDFCVAATARDSVKLRFRTTVLLDACRAVEMNPGDSLRVLREIQQLGVTIKEPSRQPAVEREHAVAINR